MSMGLIGRKLGMTRVFDEEGTAVPVTVIEAGPCTILQKRTLENRRHAALLASLEQRLAVVEHTMAGNQAAKLASAFDR